MWSHCSQTVSLWNMSYFAFVQIMPFYPKLKRTADIGSLGARKRQNGIYVQNVELGRHIGFKFEAL